MNPIRERIRRTILPALWKLEGGGERERERERRGGESNQDILKLHTVKVHFSAREKIMLIGQNGPLEKFMRFLFMHLNVACITNIIWCDNIYALQIYATAA